MRRFSSKAFLAGLIVGTVILALVGSMVRPPHLISNFRRFTISFNTRWFLATARELKAIVDATPRDKIVVVVGGSSVMQGATQAGSMVWTDALQQQLGERYVVLNMAQRSGASNDTGNVVAEMVLKDRRPLVYVCDAMVEHFGYLPIQSRYQPIVFDAWRRGYLIDWAPRDKEMRSALWSDSATLRGVAWGALLDFALNFKDLWNYVAFEWSGTIWNEVDRAASFTALRAVTDPEPTPEWLKANMPQLRAVTPRDLSLLHRMVAASDRAHWSGISTITETDFPQQLRAVTMVLVDLNNPAFLDELTPEERDRFMAQARSMQDLIERSGFPKVAIPETGFGSEDFNDRVHLSVQGGRKLAGIVAPQIEAMAKDLGYRP